MGGNPLSHTSETNINYKGFINIFIYMLDMEYSIEKDFEPQSSIHGNIEISFNTKISELDPYEPITDQLDNFVLAIGKTGRANRLTVKGDEVKVQDLTDLAESIQDIADELNKLHRLKEREKEELDEELVQLKLLIPDDGIEIEELVEYSDKNESELKEDLEELMATGEIFKPEKGVVQSI